MDVVWFLPLLVVVIGSAVVAVLVQRLSGEADRLGASQRRFRRIEDGLIPLRVETRRVRRHIDTRGR